MLINLSSPANLAITEYKVMQSSMESALLPGMRLLLNGETHIYYQTEERTPLSRIRLSSANQYLQVLGSIVKAVITVQENGFLRTNNINADSNCIFVDQRTGEASLVYIPSVTPVYPDEQTFSIALRNTLQKFLLERGFAKNPGIAAVIDDLSDKNLGWHELSYHIKKTLSAGSEKAAGSPFGRVLVLTPLENSQSSETEDDLEITKDEYRIGRKADAVDGVIKGSRLVGRIHCCIRKRGSEYYLVDLNSTNKTRLNNVELKPDQEYRIFEGDIIALANVVYTVRFR